MMLYLKKFLFIFLLFFCSHIIYASCLTKLQEFSLNLFNKIKIEAKVIDLSLLIGPKKSLILKQALLNSNNNDAQEYLDSLFFLTTQYSLDSKDYLANNLNVILEKLSETEDVYKQSIQDSLIPILIHALEHSYFSVLKETNSYSFLLLQLFSHPDFKTKISEWTQKSSNNNKQPRKILDSILKSLAKIHSSIETSQQNYAGQNFQIPIKENFPTIVDLLKKSSLEDIFEKTQNFNMEYFLKADFYFFLKKQVTSLTQSINQLVSSQKSVLFSFPDPTEYKSLDDLYDAVLSLFLTNHFLEIDYLLSKTILLNDIEDLESFFDLFDESLNFKRSFHSFKLYGLANTYEKFSSQEIFNPLIYSLPTYLSELDASEVTSSFHQKGNFLFLSLINQFAKRWKNIQSLSILDQENENRDIAIQIATLFKNNIPLWKDFFTIIFYELSLVHKKISSDDVSDSETISLNNLYSHLEKEKDIYSYIIEQRVILKTFITRFYEELDLKQKAIATKELQKIVLFFPDSTKFLLAPIIEANSDSQKSTKTGIIQKKKKKKKTTSIRIN